MALLRDYTLPFFLAALLHGGIFAMMLIVWPSAAVVPAQTIKPPTINASLIVMQAKPAARQKPNQDAGQAAQQRASADKAKALQLKQKRAEQEKARKDKEARAKAAREKAAKDKADQDQAAKARAEAARLKQLQALGQLADSAFEQALEAENLSLQAESDAEQAQSYRGGIYELVRQQWSRPPSARNGMQAKLLVELIPTGDVIAVTVVESSGNAAFDRSAEQAVRSARRFVVPTENALFEQYFRRFYFLFRPEDLLR